jgi:hypothetical protein
LGGIKAYWYIGLGFLVSSLVIAVRVLTGQNSRLRRNVETAEARIHHAKIVAQGDKKIEQKSKSRRAEARNEIKGNDDTSVFRDPNKLRDTDDNR